MRNLFFVSIFLVISHSGLSIGDMRPLSQAQAAISPTTLASRSDFHAEALPGGRFINVSRQERLCGHLIHDFQTTGYSTVSLLTVFPPTGSPAIFQQPGYADLLDHIYPFHNFW
jgi:hypothetical protein